MEGLEHLAAAPPAAFLSYVHRDDEHDGGQIRRLRDVLQGEVRMQLGEADFDIFLDRDDIAWGQNWRRRIEASLGTVTLLIPIVTPAFFASDECRRELELFLERERELGREDLILPIYYVSAPQLDVPERRERDPLARELADRQHADWRELRFEPFTSPVVRQRLAQLASRMHESFWRVEPSRNVAEVRAPATIPQGAAAQPDTAADRAGDQTPSGRNEPPTLSVDPWGQGDHTTIGAAIEAALPGTRLLVRSGLYEEGLLIDKPLEIVGQGPLQDVIVRARASSALVFKANIGRVTNLTLQQAGDGNYYGVEIAQGRLELEDCDITSESRSGVSVNGGADPRIRRNAIHDCGQAGILVIEQGLGTFEDNDIFANAMSGIEVREGGNPTVRRNRIHDGQQAGIFVNEQGLGTFEDNDISANGRAGIQVKEGGNPTARGNRIHDGQQAGIFVNEQGLGTFEDNDIFAIAAAGIEVREGGNPTLRRNRVHDCQSGVLVTRQGLGTFEDNDISANVGTGIQVKTDSNPTFRGNRIHDGQQSGIVVSEQGLGTFEDNDIFANARAGILVREGGNPTVCRNRINRNGYEAVWVQDGGGTFEENDLTDNQRGAWDVASESEQQVTKSANLE